MSSGKAYIKPEYDLSQFRLEAKLICVVLIAFAVISCKGTIDLANFAETQPFVYILYVTLLIAVLLPVSQAYKTMYNVNTDYEVGKRLTAACQGFGTPMVIETGEGQVYENKSYEGIYRTTTYFGVLMVASLLIINLLFVIALSSCKDGPMRLYALGAGIVVVAAGCLSIVNAINTNTNLYESMMPPNYFTDAQYNVLYPDTNFKADVFINLWYIIASFLILYIIRENIVDIKRTDYLQNVFKYIIIIDIILILCTVFAYRVLQPMCVVLQQVCDFSHAAYKITDVVNKWDDKKQQQKQNVENNMYAYNDSLDTTAGFQEAFKYLNVSTDADTLSSLTQIKMQDSIKTAYSHAFQVLFAAIVLILFPWAHLIIESSGIYLGIGVLMGIVISLAIISIYIYKFISM
jgi:hypothetical protein